MKKINFIVFHVRKDMQYLVKPIGFKPDMIRAWYPKKYSFWFIANISSLII